MTTTHCSGCGDEIGEAAKAKSRYCETCDTVPVFRGYARAELKDAFESIQNRENWKMPIDQVLPGVLPAAIKDRLTAAVIFFAGCEPSFLREGRNTRVTATGYYVAVGA